MNEEQQRYSCQVSLPGFGAEAQQALTKARVLIVGMGGLGCPAAQYLAVAGVGYLGLADSDLISLSNLHRQILYAEAEAGQKKVNVAAAKLRAQNPHIQISAHDVRVDAHNVFSLIEGYDIIVDATDNFETHYLLNDAAVLSGKILVYGSLYQYEGQLAVWNMPNDDGTRGVNYRDVFPEVNATLIPDCSDAGVLPTIAGIIGCMQANEVIKIISASEDILRDKLLVFDALSMQSRSVRLGPVSKVQINELPGTVSVNLLKHEDIHSIHGALLVDVRSPEEHIAFNIGGQNIPLQNLEEHRKELQKQEAIVFYCQSGKRSRQAAIWAQTNLTSVRSYSLDGGLNDL